MSITKICPTSQSRSMSITSKMNVRQALARANDSDADTTDAEAERILTAELERIWIRIQNNSNGYIMDRTEFGVFNRYRAQARFQNETAQQAVARYWNSISTADGH